MLDRAAYLLLWLFVFAIPWEDVLTIHDVGSTPARLPRLIGVAAVAVVVLRILAARKIRAPAAFHLVGLCFVIWAGTTIYWTINPAATAERLKTYLQLVLMAALIWEVADSEARQRGLLQAYVLGAFVAAGLTLAAFVAAGGAAGVRYRAPGFNANDLGFTLVLAIPMAWYLSLSPVWRGTRWLNRLYFPLGLVTMLLTASRGAFVPALVALTIVPLTLGAARLRTKAVIVLVLAVSAYAATVWVPASSWARLATTQSELRGGDLTHRRDIWRAGLDVFLERKLTGVGAGAFPYAVESEFGRPRGAHNSFIAVLVEQGVFGLALFATLFLLPLVGLRGVPRLQRRFWFVLYCTLLIGMLPRGWDYRKPTWFVLGLMVTQVAALQPRDRGLASLPAAPAADWVPTGWPMQPIPDRRT